MDKLKLYKVEVCNLMFVYIFTLQNKYHSQVNLRYSSPLRAGAGWGGVERGRREKEDRS